MKQKLTKLEKYWVLYDVGNSAFTLLVSTIIPIYLKHGTEYGRFRIGFYCISQLCDLISTTYVAFQTTLGCSLRQQKS